MTQTFECPSCGGPLDLPRDGSPTIRCQYCGRNVIVPAELRGVKPAETGGSPDSADSVLLKEIDQLIAGGNKISAIVLAIMFFSSLPALTGPGALLAALRRSNESQPTPTAFVINENIAPARAAPAWVTTPTTPPFAEQILAFGAEGIGPGLFKDARSVAVDADGNIYVGEYTGGRVQVFGAGGEFITQWLVDPGQPLRGLAADRQGTVYAVQGGQIYRFEGSNGEALGTIDYPEGRGFDDVVVAADGGLVAAWYSNRDDLVIFDGEGQVIRTIPQAISGQSGDSELNTRVAVDGLGNVYALGTFNDAVFKFNSQGKFLTRFGSAGSEPGQFRAPSSIAVDGQGRVYVGDIKGIQGFDSNGRYLELIEVEGVPSGLAFNDANELFVAARTQVIVFKINP